MKKLFLIIGAPGSGKTTDAELIAKNSKIFTHYSTGDMLRAEAASGSKLGLEIDAFISQGLIVPIKIAIQTITNAIKNAPCNNIIIDGYPRSLEQMRALDSFLSDDENIGLMSVVEIRVSEDTARDRVLGRARGVDDNNEVFNNRMKVYVEPLNDIKSFYNEKNIYHVISGEGSIEEIVSELETFLTSKI